MLRILELYPQKLNFRRIYFRIALLFFSFINSGFFCQAQIIFEETFNEANTSTSGIDNVGGVSWSSSCPTCLAGDYWYVTGGVFEGNDTNGDAVWETGLIDISSNCNQQVEITVDISEVGTMEACGTGCNSVDWVHLEYNIDGTGWQSPSNSYFCAGACAGLNVILSDDIPSGAMNYTTNCIGSGSSLQIRIGVQCWAASETWRLDNIIVSFCPASTNLIITNPSPVCAPSTVDLTAPAITAGSDAGTLSYWADAAATIPLITPNSIAASGTYYIQLDPGGCPVVMPVSVIVNPTVSPTFNALPSVCEGSAPPVLSVISNNGISGTWSPAISTVIPGTTTYTFSPNAGQCATSTTLDLTVNPTVTPTFDPIAPLCLGSTAPILPTISTNGIAGNWSSNVSTATAGTSTYVFTPSGNQCTTAATIDITITQEITPTFNPISVLCIGSTPPLLPNTSNNGIIGNWSSQVSTVAAGILTYTFTPSIGQCAQLTNIDIEVIQNPMINAGSDQTLCEGTPVTLNASGGVSYVWDNGVNNGVSFIPTLGTVTYSVIGTDAFGCSNADQLTISVEPSPSVSFVADVNSGCSPLNVIFTNTSSGSLTNCEWDFGNGITTTGCGSVDALFETSGNYSVTLTTSSTNGCSSSETYLDFITVEQNPTAAFYSSSVSTGSMNTEVYFSNTSIGATNFQWLFNDGQLSSTEVNPSFTLTSDSGGSYEVTLIAFSSLGCIDTATLIFNQEEDLLFYVPNSFTPDGDEFNQTFQPIFTSGFDPYDYNLSIFNRYGEIIFESSDAELGWDGTYHSSNQTIIQSGIYTWKIEFKTLLNDERKVVLGHVNLLR